MRATLVLAVLGALSCSAQRAPEPMAATQPSPASSVAAPAASAVAVAAQPPVAIEGDGWCPGGLPGGVGYEQVRPYTRPPELNEEQLELPEGDPCIGPELVTANDVRWTLASRDRRLGTMTVRRGMVTGFMWLDDTAIAEVENDSVRVRGLVRHPRAVLRHARLLKKHFVPDGLDDRAIFGREDGDLDLERSEVGDSPLAVLPCSDFSLRRQVIDASRLLPRALRPVIVAQEVDIELNGKRVPLARFTPTQGSQLPLGALATLHARVPPQGRSWISLSICGGTIFGTVPSSALLGRPQEPPWRLDRCLDVGQKSDPAPPALERPLRCDRDLTLYLRQMAHVDAVGNLKTGARFQVEGTAHQGRVFVTLADSPVFAAARISCFELRELDVQRHCR